MENIEARQLVLKLHTDLQTISEYKNNPEIMQGVLALARAKVNEIGVYLNDLAVVS